jgi:hypothetical protein
LKVRDITFFSRAKHIMGHIDKPQEMPHYMFCPTQKIFSRTFKIRGTLVFLCPKER